LFWLLCHELSTITLTKSIISLFIPFPIPFTNPLLVSCQEYQLLAKLNDASSAKYNTVAQHTRELLIQSQELSHQQSQLQANFDQIDEILNVALKLEETVVVLEKYMDEVEDHLAK
jgi:hypothetical protein